MADGGQDHYGLIFGSVPRIVAGSMVAYLVSQNFDVFAFHLWKERTDGRHLWFRNNASTMMSQGIGTALFITIAFAGTVPGNVLTTMLIGQYLVKVCFGHPGGVRADRRKSQVRGFGVFRTTHQTIGRRRSGLARSELSEKLFEESSCKSD